MEAALRREDLDLVAGLELPVHPGGEGTAIDMAHAHAQFVVVDAGADRVRPAQVLAVDVAAQRQVLALREAEGVAQRLGHVEAQHDGVVGVLVLGAQAQRVEVQAHGGGSES